MVDSIPKILPAFNYFVNKIYAAFVPKYLNFAMFSRNLLFIITL